MNNNKYALVKFVDEEFELSVNVSPKEETLCAEFGCGFII